ncbi:MAG TPA: restriction endonuclease [Pyrinomonadaceae bacterium]|nr:restriction endonuclease [Pyrinomonadaceae bacterium]
MKQWILLTTENSTAVWIVPEGDFTFYDKESGDDIKKGDEVYLWSNPHQSFYGWGVVSQTPQIVRVPIDRGNGDTDYIKRERVFVNRQKEFYPPITAQMMSMDKNVRKLIPTGFNKLEAIPLRPGQAGYLSDFIREHKLDAPKDSAYVSHSFLDNAPDITVQAIITLGEKTDQGRIIECVRPAWDAIVKILEQDPNEIFNIDPFKFEELIAGAYVRDGYEVELTSRSNDKGKDIIATKRGLGAVRIFDQVKRYRINRPVTAAEVRELVGTVLAAPDATQGVLTTTSTFATNLLQDQNIKRLIPYRLYLRERQEVLDWLKGLKRIIY